jgi:hypothetical protein
MQEIPCRHKLVEHLAFFFERLPLQGEMPELELRCRADAVLQRRFQIFASTADERD